MPFFLDIIKTIFSKNESDKKYPDRPDEPIESIVLDVCGKDIISKKNKKSVFFTRETQNTPKS